MENVSFLHKYRPYGRDRFYLAYIKNIRSYL
jgi:hypothetical protein